MMPRKFPKGVHSEVTRHGKKIFYYRGDRGDRIRLPDDSENVNFLSAVALAQQGSPTPRPDRITFDILRKQQIEKVVKGMLKGAKGRAMSKNLEFNIDLTWAIATIEEQNFRCKLTGIPFFADHQATRFRIDPFSPSLDRVDCLRGYTKDNVRVVLFAVNVMLMDWGTEIFERIAAGYRYTKFKSIPLPTPEGSRTLEKM